MNTRVFLLYVAAAVFYIALASGGGNPIRCYYTGCYYEFANLGIVVLMIASLMVLRVKLKSIRIIILLILLGAMQVMSGILNDQGEFALVKAWGGFGGTVFALLALQYIGDESDSVLASRVVSRFILLVLFVTVLYKAYLGELWNREVLYLVNGPIVFGWIMGIGCIYAASACTEKSAKHSDWLVLGFLLLGILWSESKGPILAMIFAISVLFIHKSDTLVKGIIRVGSVVAPIVIVVSLLLSIVDVEETRLMTLVDMYYEGINADEGSVGARTYLIDLAIDIVNQNILFGIGAGGFANYEPELMYPHNIHLEVLIEYGIFVFFVYLMVVLYGVYVGNPLYKALIIFTGICISFSGDFAYARFILPFVFYSIISNSYRSRIH